MGLGRYVVEAVVVEGRSAGEVARARGISRSWIYELLARYRAAGYEALEPRSRRPRSCPHQTSQELVDVVVALRKKLERDGLDAGKSGACRSEGLVAGEHLPDGLGELAGEVDLRDLGAAQVAVAALESLVALSQEFVRDGVLRCLDQPPAQVSRPALGDQSAEVDVAGLADPGAEAGIADELDVPMPFETEGRPPPDDHQRPERARPPSSLFQLMSNVSQLAGARNARGCRSLSPSSLPSPVRPDHRSGIALRRLSF